MHQSSLAVAHGQVYTIEEKPQHKCTHPPASHTGRPLGSVVIQDTYGFNACQNHDNDASPLVELGALYHLPLIAPQPLRPMQRHIVQFEKEASEEDALRDDDDPIVLGWRTGRALVVARQPTYAPRLKTIPLPPIFCDDAAEEIPDSAEEGRSSPTGSDASCVTYLEYPNDVLEDEIFLQSALFGR